MVQGCCPQAGRRRVYKEFLEGGLVGKYEMRFPYLVVFLRFSVFSRSCFFLFNLFIFLGWGKGYRLSLIHI